MSSRIHQAQQRLQNDAPFDRDFFRQVRNGNGNRSIDDLCRQDSFVSDQVQNAGIITILPLHSEQNKVTIHFETSQALIQEELSDLGSLFQSCYPGQDLSFTQAVVDSL